MIINSRENFPKMLVKLLQGLSYEKVELNEERQFGKVTAQKDGRNYVFACVYEIDAVSEKQMAGFIDEAKSGHCDGMIFVTNSSFSVAAKKKADEHGIELWDRNVFDRMAITVQENLEDEIPVKKSRKGLIIAIATVLVLVIAGTLLWYFKFR